MISLKQIHYALAVERTLHFKKAAEACAVSQSALSTALSEMEKQLGFQIFERNNKQVLVTPLGKQVLEKAQQIKFLMDDIEKLGEAQQEPLNTTMSLGIIPTICPYLLPVVLPTLQARYPRLQLHISEEQSHVLVEQVRHGDLDAAILALPFRCDGLLTFTFWAENFYWITHVDDDLARKQQLSKDELDPQRLMLLKEGHCLKDHALAVCHLQEVSADHLSATSLNTLVQLVANGLGTTLVPEMALPQLVESNPRIAKVPLAEPGPHREIAFVVRPNYPGLKNIELLMQLFRDQLKQL
ncbi:hydrogen peroxide-inducible genes activator [Sedimenticola thiotaurini]|uniref:LysR family transcriptional regulator n=1 Tax=Sedimenticola thiotaurini TaxID=1543721 RepID=A0A0F7K2K6_9GAMM|nr:hydrogen peroxide-inducible genes activator [Sedimenticola thiotaurini]AKH21153.1 LysR family transcriptional regulator [Sedimenticola thiotaurini]